VPPGLPAGRTFSPGKRTFAIAARRLFGCAVALAVLAGRPAAATHKLKLDLRDSGGARIDVRVSARSDATGGYYPLGIDTTVMAHAGYCYPPSGGSLTLPHGFVTLSASRGPEWVPLTRQVWLGRDTTMTIKLSRFLDMRARGFYASDLHAHSRHDPIEFNVSPANARRIARAEDLAILHLLDQEFRFTGANDSLSDANTVIYHSYEHRNMTYGHVVLPGLRTSIVPGCCRSPDEAWPLLADLAKQVSAPGQALFVLAHPWTTDDYESDTSWPGTGFGREFPLLASLGRLDGFEVASYSNQPNDRWSDWYDALSSGLRLTPTAGTDACLDIFAHKPAGGWRVYADLGAGAKLDYRAWIEAVRAGRTFVTSLPLVPRFRVAAHGPGEAFEAPADSSQLAISFEAACATGLTKLTLVSGLGPLWTLDVSRLEPARTRIDTTFTLRCATPGWIALRVDGVAGDRSLLGLPAVAHTNAVRLLKAGAPRISPVACGHMLDRLDALERKLQARRNWAQAWHEDTVESDLRFARALYGRVFVAPPAAFPIVLPPAGGAPRLSWARAADPEPGDRVRYRITVAADSLFRSAARFWSDDPWIESTPIRPSLPCWWRIEAVDRGGNVAASMPAAFRATLLVATADAPGPGADPGRPRAWPNPARGPVRLEGLGADAVVVDVAGRRVAWIGHGLRAEGRGWLWDARDRGGRVAPGLYWAISRSRRVTLPITLLE